MTFPYTVNEEHVVVLAAAAIVMNAIKAELIIQTHCIRHDLV